MAETCQGNHDLYVADVAVVQDEGTVAVIAICRSCGKTFMGQHQVTKKSGCDIKLENKKEIK